MPTAKPILMPVFRSGGKTEFIKAFARWRNEGYDMGVQHYAHVADFWFYMACIGEDLEIVKLIWGDDLETSMASWPDGVEAGQPMSSYPSPKPAASHGRTGGGRTTVTPRSNPDHCRHCYSYYAWLYKETQRFIRERYGHFIAGHYSHFDEDDDIGFLDDLIMYRCYREIYK